MPAPPERRPGAVHPEARRCSRYANRSVASYVGASTDRPLEQRRKPDATQKAPTDQVQADQSAPARYRTMKAGDGNGVRRRGKRVGALALEKVGIDLEAANGRSTTRREAGK